MDAVRFAAIVEAYGAEPRRWPEAERDAALAFVATSEAAAILVEARGLDALLDQSDAPAPVSLDFVRMAIAAAPKAHSRLSWRPYAAMAACALLGLALGIGGARTSFEADAASAALELAFGGGEAG
jgi:hypothetical protein